MTRHRQRPWTRQNPTLPAWVTGPTYTTREERDGTRVTCDTCGATAWLISPDFVRLWIDVHPSECRPRPRT